MTLPTLVLATLSQYKEKYVMSQIITSLTLQSPEIEVKMEEGLRSALKKAKENKSDELSAVERFQKNFRHKHQFDVMGIICKLRSKGYIESIRLTRGKKPPENVMFSDPSQIMSNEAAHMITEKGLERLNTVRMAPTCIIKEK